MNDSLGHAAGDALLELVAERLRETCKTSDAITRMGGDDFLVLGRLDGIEEAMSSGHRLLTRLGEPYHLQNIALARVAASIGAPWCGTRIGSLDFLIAQANRALYAAKAAVKAAACPSTIWT